jgi:hypothetical protein
MKYHLLIIAFLISLVACTQETGTDPEENENEKEGLTEWLVPVNEVFDGGPGKDGIPSVDNPFFSNYQDFTIMQPEDLVSVLENDGVIKAYPHRILDWHEIVNDRVNQVDVAITYCPLTGTTLAWDRNIDGETTTFGVSGLLYNSNLIPYDRKTESHWSQVLQKSINGKLISEEPIEYPVVEMSWKRLIESYPDAQILNTNTGFSRNYLVYPYRDYKTNNEYFLFPRAREDDRIPQKERVLAVFHHENSPKIYRFTHLPFDGGIIEDEINGNRLLVVGSRKDNFIVAFRVAEKGWKYLPDALPYVLEDPLGNRYDLFGKSAAGNLESMKQLIGYWFTFPAFYKEYDVHKG